MGTVHVAERQRNRPRRIRGEDERAVETLDLQTRALGGILHDGGFQPRAFLNELDEPGMRVVGLTGVPAPQLQHVLHPSCRRTHACIPRHAIQEKAVA
jgi:hypothetical protein